MKYPFRPFSVFPGTAGDRKPCFLLRSFKTRFYLLGVKKREVCHLRYPDGTQNIEFRGIFKEKN